MIKVITVAISYSIKKSSLITFTLIMVQNSITMIAMADRKPVELFIKVTAEECNV